MTANEVISLTGELRPHPIPETVLLRWLGELDGQIRCGLLDRYAAGEETPFDPAEEPDRELAVPPPYDGIYCDWLALCIDTALGETARANNDAALFERDRSAFAAHINRTRTARTSVIDAGLGRVCARRGGEAGA